MVFHITCNLRNENIPFHENLHIFGNEMGIAHVTDTDPLVIIVYIAPATILSKSCVFRSGGDRPKTNSGKGFPFPIHLSSFLFLMPLMLVKKQVETLLIVGARIDSHRLLITAVLSNGTPGEHSA